MNFKCEWKGGEFYGCHTILRLSLIKRSSEDIKKHGPTSKYLGQEISFCPFCGEDIRQPVIAYPTHEDIMTKWWKDGDIWFKVIKYVNGLYGTSHPKNKFLEAEWFECEVSADIPPEEENE